MPVALIQVTSDEAYGPRRSAQTSPRCRQSTIPSDQGGDHASLLPGSGSSPGGAGPAHAVSSLWVRGKFATHVHTVWGDPGHYHADLRLDRSADSDLLLRQCADRLGRFR